MKEYSNEHLSLNVRFYFGDHARWRFYIFSRPDGKNTSVLLSDYDKETPGFEMPMYKIIKKEKNIASFMTRYFDELWDTALTPMQLFMNIQSGECIRHFYKDCNKETKCLNCPHTSCDYREQCIKLINKYADTLKGFNVR